MYKKRESGVRNVRVRPRGTDGARVIHVIETRSLIGAGTENDPCRRIIQYWDFNGRLLAKSDGNDESICVLPEDEQ